MRLVTLHLCGGWRVEQPALDTVCTPATNEALPTGTLTAIRLRTAPKVLGFDGCVVPTRTR